MPNDAHTDAAVTIPLTDHFAEGLADAQLLLRYAAESGISDIVEPILLARLASTNGVWTDAAMGAFISAFTRLAAMLKPVSIASLKTSERVVMNNVRTYRRWGAVLTGLVIVLSLINFVNSGIADRISKDIDENNQLAVACGLHWDRRTCNTPRRRNSARSSPARQSPLRAYRRRKSLTPSRSCSGSHCFYGISTAVPSSSTGLSSAPKNARR